MNRKQRRARDKQIKKSKSKTTDMEQKLGFAARPIKGYIPDPEVIVKNNKHLRDQLLLPILKEMKKIKDSQQLAIKIKN